MVLDAVGAALPAALGIASSPIPIVAVVLVLATPRATVNGTAFAAAWVLGLVLAGVESIQDRDLDGTDQVVAAVIFVALASSTVLLAVLAHVVAPERSARVLGRVKQFMIDHKAAITVVILVLLGLRFLYDGVTELG